MTLATLERQPCCVRRTERHYASHCTMNMSAAEFQGWKARRRYSSEDPRYRGLTQATEDLCVPKSSVSDMLSGSRRVPPDVARICAMVDFLDSVALIKISDMPEQDRMVIYRIRNLLSVWSLEPRTLRPEGHWAWQELRIDRLCLLSAAVHSVVCTTAPVLAKARRQADEMVKSWRCDHANQA